MEALDRRSLLRLGAGLIAAGCGWELVGRAHGAVDPRLKQLQGLVEGPVLAPSNPAYPQARLEYQQRFDSVYPLAVVQPLSTADVSAIVGWSRKTKVRLAIRSGGHSYAGYSTGSGVVVDLGRLAAVKLDKASNIATVGAGARLIDVEAALATSNRAIPNGSCPTVGVGGLALGGGVGFASRAFGTLSDNVVQIGIVTADGKHTTCSATRNPDLFWACRGGGGGNFGVVTSFAIRCRLVPSVSTFRISWPWSEAAAVIGAFQTFAPSASDELFTVCYLRNSGAGASVECHGQFLGAESQLATTLKPLTSVAGATPTLESESYMDAQLKWAGCGGQTVGQCHLVGGSAGGTQPRGNFLAKSDYVSSPLSSAGLSTITTWLEKPPDGAFGSLILDSYGGAINRVAPDATAFVHRDALFSAQYVSGWSQPAGQAAALAWLRGFRAAMRPYVSGFAYQNYIDPDLTTWKHAYYGANYPRLRAVKAKVDPDWLFRFAQGIPPD